MCHIDTILKIDVRMAHFRISSTAINSKRIDRARRPFRVRSGFRRHTSTGATITVHGMLAAYIYISPVSIHIMIYRSQELETCPSRSTTWTNLDQFGPSTWTCHIDTILEIGVRMEHIKTHTHTLNTTQNDKAQEHQQI